MAKSLWVYCLSPMFSKTWTFLYFYIISHLFSFWNTFPTPSPSPSFFPSPATVPKNLFLNLKPYVIYKLSLVVLFSAVMLCL